MADILTAEEPTGAGLLEARQTHRNSALSWRNIASSVESTHEMNIPASTPINETDVIEFVLRPNGLNYLDMQSTRLVGKIKIMKLNGDGAEVPTTDTDDYSVISGFPLGLFRQVTLNLNGTDVSDQSNHLACYKNYFETLFSHSKQQQELFLKQSIHWIPDPSGTETANAKPQASASPSSSGSGTSGSSGSSSSSSTSSRSGYVLRQNAVAKSKTLHFEMPLHIDMFNCSKLLLPGMTARIRLTRNSEKFCLLAGTDTTEYKIKFVDLSLTARYLSLSPAVTEKHAAMLNSTPAIYKFPTARMTTHTLLPNTTSINIPNLSSGILPHFCLLGFVDSESLEGKITKNPWHFQNFDINQLYFQVNSKAYPRKVLQPDYENKFALREYLHLVRNLALDSNEHTIPISYESFITGNNFYAIDISGDLSGQSALNTEKFGSLECYIQFKSAPTKPIKMVVYAIYDQQISIDKDRNVRVEL